MSIVMLPTAIATSWDAAAADFLDSRHLAAGTRTAYASTFRRLSPRIGSRPLVMLSPAELAATLRDTFGDLAPNTWNRHAVTVRSLLTWCRRQGILERPQALDLADAIERRHAPVDYGRALPHAFLEELWRRRDVPLREKTLWRMLYETAGRAQEVLRLNIEDLDLANRRARTVRKGGDLDSLHWASGTAQLLPRLLEGRRRGPVFLANLRPSPARSPAAGDVDPATGRARLSYRRAAELFTEHSDGKTLHQLRHSLLADWASQGVPAQLLQAKSRHTSSRSLQRYAVPTQEAVARLTAQLDPNARRGREAE
jgi:integrase